MIRVDQKFGIGADHVACWLGLCDCARENPTK